MFWDGTRWIDEQTLSASRSAMPRRTRRRPWPTVAVVVVGLIALSLPTAQPGAAQSAAVTSLAAAWDVGYETAMHQESWSEVSLAGDWWRGRSSKFLDNKAVSAKARGSRFEVTFSGTGIAIIGPRSKLRGKARILVNGRHVETVDAYSPTYRKQQPLFVATWDTERTRTVEVVVSGTDGRSKFTVDAAVVRGRPRSNPKIVEPPSGGLAITNVSAGSITTTSAVITWTVSEPATGQVDYGTTTAYGQSTQPEGSLAYTTHVQWLTGLQPGTTYHFRTRSVDAAGDAADSGDHTFVTLPVAPLVTPTAAPTSEPAPTEAPAPSSAPAPTSEPPDQTPAPTRPPAATPAPTATPKPTPTPTPKPTPTPSPTSAPSLDRPFAAPSTDATYRVPASIDATGSTNAAGALNAFIDSVPNGSVISFPGSGIYRLNKGLLLAGRRNIVLDGNGATLRINGSGSDEALSAFLLRGSSHIAIRDFRVIGSDPNWPANSGENAHVLGLSGWYGGAPSTYVEMSNVRASHIFGDGVYLEGRNTAPYPPSQHVWIHHNSFDYMGRNGVSLIDVTDVLIEDNTFDHISYHVVDFEPNFASQVVRNVTFRQNTVGSYAHRKNLLGFFVSSVAIESGEGSMVSGVTIANNTVAGIASDGYEGRPRALNSKFISTGTRHSDIVFRGNVTTRAVAGPAVLYFSGIDGVRVSGNVQPLSSGTLTAFSSCTGVTQ